MRWLGPEDGARRVLVTGFGPFLNVTDNPSARIARALDGAHVSDEAGDISVIGREIPVSYVRGPARTVALARRWRVHAIVGVGVARGRVGVNVERHGRLVTESASPDVDGRRRTDLEPEGPACLTSTIPVGDFAGALGALVSEDAGGYVCNAWLYSVLRVWGSETRTGLCPRVTFVHVSEQGLSPEILLAALPALWGDLSTADATKPSLPNPALLKS